MNNTEKEDIVDFAIEYAERFQCSVIPLNPESKKPLLSEWKPFQSRIATREEIKTWWTKWPKAMIGIVTGKCSDLFVIDVDPGGEKSFKELFQKEPETPTAITPRNGRHYYFAYPDAKVSIKAGMLPNLDYRGEGGYVVAPPSMNSSYACYEWVPNLAMQDILTVYLPTNILDYILSNSSTYINTIRDRVKNVDEETDKNEFNFLRQGQRDHTIFHLANTLFKGGLKEDEVRSYLTVFAKQCKPQFSEKEMEEKIQSASKRITARSANLTQDFRNWINSTTETFSIQDIHKDLQLDSNSYKNIHSQTNIIMNRLKEEGLVEKVNGRGLWRKVIGGYKIMDVWGATDKITQLDLPLGLEKYYVNVPKSIIVIAGQTNVGKSLFCLITAYLNRDRYKVKYISSEMRETKLKRRIKKFGFPEDEWKKIDFIEFNQNYCRVVRDNGDGLTIIDFLECHDEFYRIGGWINDVYNSLNTGTSLIAIQKDSKRDFGRGGEGTAEKASLYLAMDYNKVKIMKCKEWPENKQNPHHYSCEFEIENGCKFINQSYWGVGVGENLK